MATVKFFRDSLTLDDSLTALTKAGVTPQPGDTLFLGARLCTIAALSGDYNYVIGADTLSVASPSPLDVSGTSANKSPNVTILAVEINGPFSLECRGMAGAPGRPGTPGRDGKTVIVAGKPRFTLPTPGGPGGNGTPGSPGGNVILHYCSALQHPTATAPGGQGGASGPGGRGGRGSDEDGESIAADGKPGRAGPAGGPGTAVVTQVSTAQIWTSLDRDTSMAWASYRTEVGAYFFRLFDFGSQLLALREFTAALQLDHTNADAQTLLNRIVQQQTPTGLSRDIDISPDYKDLSSNLHTEAVLVQGAFAAAAAALQEKQTATGFGDVLGSIAQQLTDRQTEAEDSVKLAQEDVDIASKETSDLSDQIKNIQNQLQDLQNQPFSIGTFISNVGSLAASIASVATGIGAIVSIPGSIIAIDKSASSNPGGISTILEDLDDDKKDSPGKSLSENLSKIGTGLGDLVKEVNSNVPNLITNFASIEAELDGAASQAEQTQAAQLLKQLASLVKQQMIAQLREKQAHDRVAAAQRQAQDLATEAKNATDLATNWQKHRCVP
jgi:hypothetical protein